MAYRRIFFVALVVAAVFSIAATAALSSPLQYSPKLPVNFQAKQLSHDDEQQTVTAIGDVELEQGGKILHADKMVYNLATDTVSAIGNVSLLEEDGSIHFAEYVELNRNMKDGFIQGLLSLLADGSRFTAAEAKREGGVKTTMTEAAYTPCKVCEDDPNPLWQIKADKVVYDQEKRDVSYKNARLEFAGVPLAWTPIFSHPDPGLKRKGGFLRPSYGWTTDLGTHIKGGYYFDIAPDRDATLTIQPTTRAGVLGQGQWRERFRDGRIEINGSLVQSDRKESDGRVEDVRVRGHLFADGRFDLDEKWRAGFTVERASDRPYLRFYDISKENVLDTEVYAERFSGRDYSRVSALSFQDVRLGIRPDQPDVLPSAEHTMYGEPGALWGGRWMAGVSALGIRRPGGGQDMQRASAEAGWQRRKVTAPGIVLQADAEARGDFYSVQDRDAAVLNPGLDGSANAARGMAVARLVASYPVVRRFDKAQAVIEPVAGFSVSPQVDNMDEDIPNEDSVDIQFDTNNLFSTNRFPGIDRQEDGVRADYGLKAGLYGDNGRYGKVFFGQSYRFDDDAIFPQGSGLEGHASDVVGQINLGLSRYVNADYRVQFDNENLAARRHELQATGGNSRFSVETRYMYIDTVAGTGFVEPREQLKLGGSYNFTPNWKLSTSALTDFGEEPGLRKASLGVAYTDECFTFGVSGMRNLAREVSGEGETVLMMRIGLKNLGEFSAPDIQLKGDAEERE